jgi:hypothetical protein
LEIDVRIAVRNGTTLMTAGRYSVAKVLRDLGNPVQQLVTICAADRTPRNIDYIWGNGDGKLGGRLARGGLRDYCDHYDWRTMALQ